MQILQISPSRKPQQVWLKFSDDSLLPLRVDDVVSLKLKKFIDITPEFYHTILLASGNYLLIEYCLRQLAISPKTQKILVQKLKIYVQRLVYKYKFKQDLLNQLIDPTINKIISLELLNDQNYIAYIQRKFSKKSQYEIQIILSQQGIHTTLPIDPRQEINKIKNLIIKKYSKTNLSDYNEKNKLINSLYRRGFAGDYIKIAIDETQKVG
ncbi:MAG: RecX family transcriptional regulator [Microgenomates group bacterium]